MTDLNSPSIKGADPEILVFLRTTTMVYGRYSQRKLGSNTSVLRMTFTMMKGGARVRLDLDAIDYDEGWCASET